MAAMRAAMSASPTWGPSIETRKPIGLTLADQVEERDQQQAGGRSSTPGNVIPIELELRKIGALADVVVIKTQLNGQGQVVGGHTSGLQSGSVDPMAWPLETNVIDRRGLLHSGQI